MMDIIKQYISQSITAASNNLRLNTQKIEVVALLREFISNSADLENDIREMKKITELSKLAIRLNEIYNFLTNRQIDFLRLSEKFKEHSQYLIKDLSNMTDVVSPAALKQIINRFEEKKKSVEEISAETIINESTQEVSADLPRRSHDTEFAMAENDALKEDLIMEEDQQDDQAFFQNYETNILEPVKPVDNLLKNILNGEAETSEMIKYAEIMNKNGELSAKIGFDIIANMHRILSRSLYLIANEELSPLKDVIDAMRSCLIVVVAVVKGKEVDITNYLNKAEEFGRQIQALNKAE